mmetsp:Transcript_44922/g.124478  ORF Transcript_44922/g.124478 Transcript_44922/m.124478 type:complete len:220 (-) Transcript_44922:902-1561(-)
MLTTTMISPPPTRINACAVSATTTAGCSRAAGSPTASHRVGVEAKLLTDGGLPITQNSDNARRSKPGRSPRQSSADALTECVTRLLSLGDRKRTAADDVDDFDGVVVVVNVDGVVLAEAAIVVSATSPNEDAVAAWERTSSAGQGQSAFSRAPPGSGGGGGGTIAKTKSMSSTITNPTAQQGNSPTPRKPLPQTRQPANTKSHPANPEATPNKDASKAA